MSGGGIFVMGDYSQKTKVKLELEMCRSAASGGGMSVGGNFIQEGGSLKLKSCTAKKRGGGLQIKGSFKQEHASASFYGCRASVSGGGMDVQHDISLSGSNSFRQCTAGEGRVSSQGCGSLRLKPKDPRQPAQPIPGSRHETKDGCCHLSGVPLAQPSKS